jgi:hypothetical protein
MAAGQPEHTVWVEHIVQLQGRVCGGEDHRGLFPGRATRSRLAASCTALTKGRVAETLTRRSSFMGGSGSYTSAGSGACRMRAWSGIPLDAVLDRCHDVLLFDLRC